MAYNSAHTGPEIDAAVQLLGQIQEARDSTSQDLSKVKDLASQVKGDAAQVAGQTEAVTSKASQVSQDAATVEQARQEVVGAAATANEAMGAASLSAASALESQNAASISEQAAASSQLAAGLSEQVSAESASEAKAAADQVADDRISAAESAASAAASAQNAEAVVTGGTASVIPGAGLIPLANAEGKIGEDWLPPSIARSEGVQSALEAAEEASNTAAEAQSRSASFLLTSPEAPVLRDDGKPLQVGDRYFNTEDQTEYIYKSSGWQANDSIVAIGLLSDSLADNSDPTKGSDLVGFDGGSVQNVLIFVKPFSSYAAIRSYSGPATAGRINHQMLGGDFLVEEGSILDDDDGTVIVDSIGRRWLRQNVKHMELIWFGAKGDGITDDSAAINKAFSAANTRGIGSVYINTGYIFRKADTGPMLIMYPGTTLFGSGEQSVIWHDDRPTNNRRDMLQVQPSTTLGVSFRDFKIKGNVEQFTVETNQSQCLTGADFVSVFMQNVTIDGCRFMSTAFTRIKDAIVTGCRIRNSMRDGIRFTHSRNVKVIGNHFYKVADDAVALHSVDGNNAVMLPCNHEVSDNTFEYSQGICVLGAKQLKIHDNNMRFMLRSPIRITNTSTLAEGNTPLFDISIKNNDIADTLALYNSTSTDMAIRINVRERTGAAPKPGVGASQFDYNWIGGPDFQADLLTNPGAFGINISGNKVSRTWRGSGIWTDLGDGLLLDRLGAFNPPGFYNPTITPTFFDIGGVEVSGPARGLTINDNEFYGLGVDKTVIKLPTSSSSGVYEDYTIHDNKIVDCPGFGIDLSMSSGIHRNISVRNNVIDLDPLFRHPSHNADNTWANTTATTCILTGNAQLVGTAEGNTFAHAARIVDTPSRMSWGSSNEAVWQPNGGTGLDGTATNRGIRYIPSGVRFIHTIYNGDPTSLSFKNILTKPMMFASSMPSTGTYVYGHVTEASIPILSGSTGSRYLVTKWVRLTTGSGHVLSTDWAEARSFTGT